MKTISLVSAAILAATMSLSAQHSLCAPFVSGSSLTSASNRSWFFDLTVTSGSGVTVSSVDVLGDADSVWQVYVRTGGYAGQTNNPSAWTSLGSYTIPSNLPLGTYGPLDINDRFFAQGTHGIAVVRTSSGADSTPYTTSFPGASGPGASISGGQSRSGQFSGTLNSRMVAACVRYHVGPYGRFNMSSSAPNGPLLTTPLSASPADVYGETGGQNTSSLFYPDATIATFSAPVWTNSNELLFDHWTVNGVQQQLFQRVISLTTGGVQSLTAHYDLPRVVTVQTTCNGVATASPVSSAPSDRFGSSTAMSGETFEFRRLTQVTFSAAPIHGDCVFQQWRVDGVVVPSSDGSLTTTISADTTITAEYGQPSSCYETDIGPGLGMGDDTLSTNHALGFDFPIPDGGTTNAIDISSNGFLWLQSGSSTDTAPSAILPHLWQNPARICALWSDLVMPTPESDVHFRAAAGRAIITWKNVRMANRPEMFTVQCVMFPSGRVQFAHLGEFPGFASITGVVAGTSAINQPAPVDIRTQPTWSSPYEAGWYWQPFPSVGQLAPRVFTAAPTADGFAGFDLSGVCTPASSLTYGSGCTSPMSFYQFGDGLTLSDTSYRMTPNASGGYDIDVSATSLFETTLGTATGLADDALQTVDLPFSFAYPTNPTGTSSIAVCSNGFLWLEAGSTTNTAFQPSVAGLVDMPARVAPFWVDLNPSDSQSDDVYVNALSDRVVITWNDCVRYGTSVPLTAQCVLWADGSVTFSYGSSTYVSPVNVLTGWSPGYGEAAGPSIELATAVPFTTSASDPLMLAKVDGSTPAIGQSFGLVVSNVKPSATACALFLGVTQEAIDLDFLGATGCSLLTSTDISTPIAIAGSTATLTIDLPADPVLVGDVFYTQAAVIDPSVNSLGVATSNGVALTIGDF